MSKPRIRCAIYMRKSSDEGLDQDFNSLDAQAEAFAAYISSQRHEGWVAGKAQYDDGGMSGGTLDRPALQRLLADIDAGLVQMVVVYKIDHLTRSLADFAELVERFDATGCSFVSVTQAFNTASSMGRLTLICVVRNEAPAQMSGLSATVRSSHWPISIRPFVSESRLKRAEQTFVRMGSMTELRTVLTFPLCRRVSALTILPWI